MESTNISSKKRKIMLDYLESLRRELSSNPKNEKIISDIEAELNEKKYGLIWEEHEEKVDEELKTKIPVFKEFEDKKIENDKNKKFNFLLEGDNLHSLYLLEKTHKNKIDLIIIDPPYNTEHEDFTYSDTKIGNDDLFKHSKWLSFMKNRLDIAKELLKDTGYIFIDIDEHEVAQLKLLCDEIFLPSNFVGIYMWEKTSTPPALSNKIRKKLEYILCYAKSLDNNHKFSQGYIDGGDAPLLNSGNPIGKLIFPKHIIKFNIGDGIYKNSENYKIKLLNDVVVKNGTNENEMIAEAHFKWGQNNLNEEIRNGTYFLIKSNQFSIRYQKANNETIKIPQNLLNRELGIGTNEEAQKELKDMGLSNFSYPKPVSLYKFLIKMANLPNNITILDFFAGSGTTGDATLRLNEEDNGTRNFILCTNNEKKKKKKLDYIHDCGYMNEYNPGNQTKAKVIENKISAFLDENENIKQQLFENSKKYENYGICRDVTYQRLKTLLTGKKKDETAYDMKLNENIKYYKTEYVDKFDEDKYITNELEKYIVELIQLENGIDETNKTIQIIFDTDELNKFVHSDKLKDCKVLYKDRNVLLSSKEMAILYKNKIKCIDIPEYYYKNEIMEVNEW